MRKISDWMLDPATHVKGCPQTVPAGKVLVHNHIRCSPKQRSGVKGFRAYFLPPRKRFVPCGCGWAPDIKKHFRFVA